MVLKVDHMKQPDDPAPLAPLLRMAWQHARRRIYEGVRHAGYDDLGLADLGVFLHPTPEGARPTDLAGRALLTKQAINRIIRHLQECGYLELEPAPSDHRARVVRLTDRGRGLLVTIRKLHAEVEAEWASRMGPRRLAALRRAMAELAGAIGGRPTGTTTHRSRGPDGDHPDDLSRGRHGG